MALPYAEQLEHKARVLSRALARYPVLGTPAPTATVPADPVTGFRVRSKLVAGDRALGLFARGSHALVDIPKCVILTPRLASVVAELRRALPLPGPVSSFDLREADAGVLVTAAVPPGLEPARRRELAERIAELDANVVSVAVSTREADAPQLLGGDLDVLVGPRELRHSPAPDAPWHYAAHGAFVQAHAGQLVRLHEAIEAELTPRSDARSSALAGTRVLELYAGSGALSLRLAARGAHVTLVESFAPAVRLAELAAREQGIALAAVAADAQHALGALVNEAARFDAVIVDPPRRGLGPEVRRRIAALAPERILYVSCDPETLARDAAHLSVLGYGLVQATPFDMIPQSDAVEALARFERREPPAPPVLDANETFLAVDKPPHEPVTSDREPSLFARVRALSPSKSPVSVDRLDAGASGACVFAQAPQHAAAVERALGGARDDYLVLARGILRARGTLPHGKAAENRPRYERLEVLGGHSLLVVRAAHGDVAAVTRALARLGHPVLGDARHGDRRSNAHFAHRYGLERPFVHRSALELVLGEARRVEAPLAPDLELVLGRLRASARERG